MAENTRASKRRVVTQRDVAEAAGVDRATVSRALDPKKRLLISPDTIERVLSTAEQMGYRTNLLARGLRTARSGVIGLEIPGNNYDAASLLDKPVSSFVTSVEERLAQRGLTLLVTFAHASPGEAASDRFTSNGMIDGLIKLYTGGQPGPNESTQIPLVSVGLDPDPTYDLVIHEGRGIEIAVEHLHRMGHRRIGLVCEPPSQARGERHLRAYRNSIDRLGLLAKGEEEPVAYYHQRHPASAPKAVEMLSVLTPRPTAIVLTDDKAAMGAYGGLRVQRVQIPQEVSLVGWSDSAAGLFLISPLTTIALPMRSTAFAATDLLLERIDGAAAAATPRRIFDPYLVQRASTAPPSHEVVTTGLPTQTP